MDFLLKFFQKTELIDPFKMLLADANCLILYIVFVCLLSKYGMLFII